MKNKKILSMVSVVLAMTMVFGMTACGKNNSTIKVEPATNPSETTTQFVPEETDEPVLELTKVVTAEVMAELDKYYPDLVKLNVTGSDCYDEILAYIGSHPNVEVIYTVSIGDTTVINGETSLDLEDGTYDYDALKTNLKYLPNISAVTFTETTLTDAQITDLRTAYPEVGIKYTRKEEPTTQAPVVTPPAASVTDTKIEVSASWPVYDWTNVTSADIDSAIANAKNLSGTCLVKLNSSLTKADVKALQQAAPNAIFDYSFTLYGKTISTLSKTVAYTNVKIGDAGAPSIREALDILTKCTYFKLDNCSISNEVMASIRSDYAKRTTVVWRVYGGGSNRSWLTDTTVLRAVYHVEDSNSGPLKYLTNVRYVDLGHNTNMKDLTFLGHMPYLEICILSGSPITDVSPLANCKKLEFLELAWCGWLEDITPLAQCTGLKHVNLGHTRVKDLSPLKNLSLQQLSYVNSGNRVGFTAETWAAIKAQHPNCIVTYEPLADNNATPYSIGWRYKAEGGYTDCYRKVRQVFNLDEIDKLLQSGQK